MVSKDRSFSAPVASRKPSSLRRPPPARRAGSAGASVRQPVQEPGQRRAVADVGPARALDLDGVLAGAGQGGGIGRRAPPRAPAASSASKYQADDCAGSTSTVLAGQVVQGGGKVLRRLQRHLVAEPGRQVRRSPWPGSRNRRAVPSALRIAWASGRGERMHVAAADVEQPGDGGRRGDHRGFRALLGQIGCRRARAWPASPRRRYSQRMRDDRRAGLRRPLPRPRRRPADWSPPASARAPALAAAVASRVQRVGAVQAGIVADRPAGLGRPRAGRPARRRRRGRGSRTGPGPPGRAPAGRSGRRRRSPPCPSGSPPRRPSR